MPLNTPAVNVALDGLDETVGAGIDFYGLHTLTDPGTATDALTGEVTGGSPAYARKAAVWGAAASGAKSNSGSVVFDVPASTTVGFVTYWNASTGNTNNFLGYGHLNSTIKGFGSVDATDVTNNTITSVAHGLPNDRRVMVYNVHGESLPAGLTEGVIYFVVGTATDTFQVSLTQGGAAVDITGKGELWFADLVPETFAAQGTLTLNAAAIVLDGAVLQ